MARTLWMNLFHTTRDSVEGLYYSLLDIDNTPLGDPVLLPSSLFSYHSDYNEHEIFENDIFYEFPDVAMIFLFPYTGGLYFSRSDKALFFLDHCCIFDAQSLVDFSRLSVGGSTDLTSVLDAIQLVQNRVDTLPDYEAQSSIVLSALGMFEFPSSTVDFSPIIDAIGSLSSSFALSSLDGAYDSYPNGTVVQIYPSSRDYTVVSSTFFRNDTNQFVIMYTISDENGKTTIVPHNFLIIPTVEEV